MGDLIKDAKTHYIKYENRKLDLIIWFISNIIIRN